MGNRLWDLYAKFYDSTVLNFSAYDELLQRIEKEIILSKKELVFNIGCGTGNLEERFLGLSSQFNWIAIDQSESMLEIAQKKIGDDEKFRFQIHSMDDLESLGIGACNYVLMINSLYASNDPFKTLSFVFASLNSDGKLIIANPKATSSITKMLNYERINRGLLRLIIIVLKLLPSLIINILIRIQAGRGNFHFFSEKEMKELLEEIGFKSIVIEDSYANQSIFVTAIK